MAAAAAPQARRASTGPGWSTRMGMALQRLFGRRGAKADKTAKDDKPVKPTKARDSRFHADEPEAPDPQQRAQWKAACKALTMVLSKHPSARTVFRQLTMLENTLLDRGPKVMPKLPLELLEGALKQLETLVTDWSARDLAFLRSQISVVVRNRQRLERTEANELSVLVTPERLQVREATDSVYMEFQHHFTASQAGDALRRA